MTLFLDENCVAQLVGMDDALSAVDTRTERSILQHLRARAGDCTLVIVSHRISAVQEADIMDMLDVQESSVGVLLVREAVTHLTGKSR